MLVFVKAVVMHLQPLERLPISNLIKEKQVCTSGYKQLSFLIKSDQHYILQLVFGYNRSKPNFKFFKAFLRFIQFFLLKSLYLKLLSLCLLEFEKT